MKHLPLKKVDMQDEYRGSSPELFCYGNDGAAPARMTRVGVTAPHYPMHPTYGKVPFSLSDPVYVFEDGFFWLSGEWHEYYRIHNMTPAQAAVARQGEPEGEGIPVNLTIDDMEWEAEMVFGYDGWDDDEGDGYPDEEEPPMEQGRLWEEE